MTPAEKRAIAASGVLRDPWTGIPRYEQNPDLHPYRARGLQADHGVYHEMVRSDGAIAGTIGLYRRELSRCRWRVDLPPSPSSLEVRWGQLVERALGLGEWTSRGWVRGGLRRIVDQLSLASVYGFSLLEPTWETRIWEGQIVRVPTSARWRAPWSIERWIWRGDELVAAGQVAGDMGIERRLITMDRALLHVHDYVDGNPEGTSALRSAFIPWLAKKETIVRHQIAEEHLFGGWIEIAEGGTEERGAYPWLTQQDRETLSDAIGAMRANEVDHLIKPYGWELREHHPEFSIPSRVEELKYYDHQIFLASLAGLLGLDAGHAASKALSDGLGAILYNAIAAEAGRLEETINGNGEPYTGLVARIGAANLELDESVRAPRLVAHAVQHPNVQAYVDTVLPLFSAGVLDLTDADQRELRAMSSLPDVTDGARRTVPGSTLAELRAVVEARASGAISAEAAAALVRLAAPHLGPDEIAALVDDPAESDPEPAAVVDDESAPAPAVSAEGAEAVQDLAMNGAQIAALQEVVVAVSTGVLPAGAAEVLLLAAFPSMSEEQVAIMLASAESAPAPAEVSDVST